MLLRDRVGHDGVGDRLALLTLLGDLDVADDELPPRLEEAAMGDEEPWRGAPQKVDGRVGRHGKRNCTDDAHGDGVHSEICKAKENGAGDRVAGAQIARPCQHTQYDAPAVDRANFEIHGTPRREAMAHDSNELFSTDSAFGHDQVRA
jgi:hypothetical protein